MNPLAFLNPYRWLLLLALIAALVLGYHAWADHQRDIGRAEQRDADRAAAEAQTARNRELQRAAEKRYTVAAAARDRFIVETITEVRHATAALAACPLGADAVRLLNDAAGCARGDSAAACSHGQPVRDTPGPAAAGYRARPGRLGRALGRRRRLRARQAPRAAAGLAALMLVAGAAGAEPLLPPQPVPDPMLVPYKFVCRDGQVAGVLVPMAPAGGTAFVLVPPQVCMGKPDSPMAPDVRDLIDRSRREVQRRREADT